MTGMILKDLIGMTEEDIKEAIVIAKTMIG